jgi:hypothetical protein
MSRSEETAGTDGSGRARYPLLWGILARQDLVTGAVLWRSSRAKIQSNKPLANVRTFSPQQLGPPHATARQQNAKINGLIDPDRLCATIFDGS